MDTQPPRRLLLTRPQAQSEGFAAQIEAAMPGLWTIDIAPVMEIVPTGTAPDLSGFDGVIFSSGNGVAHFTAVSDQRDVPVICVGEVTTQLAREAGFAAEMGGETIRALIAQFETRPPGRYCHLRGAHAAGRVPSALAAAGHQVEVAVLYDQKAVDLPPAVLDDLESGVYDVVPLFSPRTAKLLFAALGARTLAHRTRLLCLSENVADVAMEAHSGPVHVSRTPDAQAMLLSLQAIAAI